MQRMTTYVPVAPQTSAPLLVYIPCPAEFAVEATRAVADVVARHGMSEGPEPLVGSSTGNLAPADPSAPGSFATWVGNPNGVWDGKGYAMLRAKATISAHRAVRIGDALADAGPDQLVAMSDLADRTSMTTNEVRSALSKLSQFIALNRDVFPDYVWPFGWRYGREIDPQRPREFHYLMTSEQAAAWDAGR